MLRDNLVRLIVPMRSCGTQALGDEFSYLENPRPVGAESSLTGRCSSPFQTEPRHILVGRCRPRAFIGASQFAASTTPFVTYSNKLITKPPPSHRQTRVPN